MISYQKAPAEPILEEAELEFRPLEEGEEYCEKDENEVEHPKEPDSKHLTARHEGMVDTKHFFSRPVWAVVVLNIFTSDLHLPLYSA